MNLIEEIKYNNIDNIKLLLQDDRLDQLDINYVIMYVSEYGYLEVIKMLLKDDRVDPSDDGNFSYQNCTIYEPIKNCEIII